MSTKLADVPLDLPACVAALSRMGVETTHDLLAQASGLAVRKRLADRAQLPEGELNELVAAADLVRVPGVGPKWAALLVRGAGIRCVQDLATRNVEELAGELRDANLRLRTLARIPRRRSVERAVRAARQMRPCVVLEESVAASTKRDFEHLVQRLGRLRFPAAAIRTTFGVLFLLPFLLAGVFYLWKRPFVIFRDPLERLAGDLLWALTELVFLLCVVHVWGPAIVLCMGLSLQWVFKKLCYQVLRPRAMRRHDSRELYVCLNRFRYRDLRRRVGRVDHVFVVLLSVLVVGTVLSVVGGSRTRQMVALVGMGLAGVTLAITVALLCVPETLKVIRLARSRQPFGGTAIRANLGLTSIDAVGGLAIVIVVINLAALYPGPGSAFLESVVRPRHNRKLDELARQAERQRVQHPKKAEPMAKLLRSGRLERGTLAFTIPRRLVETLTVAGVVLIGVAAVFLILIPLALLGHRSKVLVAFAVIAASYIVDYGLHRFVFGGTGLLLGTVGTVGLLLVLVPTADQLFGWVEDAVEDRRTFCRACGTESSVERTYCGSCSTPLSE